MLNWLINLLAKLFATLLGALAVGAQLGNTVICITAILFGPAIVLGLLSR